MKDAKLRKKGLAPYISWVLLIAFAASLSVFMYSWITDEVTISSTEIEKRSDTNLCEETSINIDDYCQNTQTLNMNITNVNLVEVNALKFRFIDLYDNSEVWDYNISLRPQNTENIEVLKQGTVKQVEIIPKLYREDNVITCTKSLVTLENIKIC